MNDTHQSQCRIRRTGLVSAIDSSCVHAEVGSKRVSIPIGKCESAVRTGDRIAWDGRQWIVCDPDVQS
ncbi:MAG: hypothetical protein J7559_13255 [Cohnella sp.]|nr:hypothetical protein [Cohnella sp.]